MNLREQGLRRIREVLGDKGVEAIENYFSMCPDFARYVTDFGYGEIYSRQGLNDKTRELAAVVSLITQGKTGLPLRVHLGGMLNVGWTKKEIVELIIFLIGFNGFPSTIDAIKTAYDVFGELQ
ncbi:MAG: carboxymuconolactone decarboxylase family protein [Verrucomicrobia bacterium]|nr:carboxymuconolactone decarboxylase family protein [Verrucomicrobiota bacterium]